MKQVCGMCLLLLTLAFIQFGTSRHGTWGGGMCAAHQSSSAYGRGTALGSDMHMKE